LLFVGDFLPKLLQPIKPAVIANKIAKAKTRTDRPSPLFKGSHGGLAFRCVLWARNVNPHWSFL